MEHSVQKYLERQTTEKLKIALQGYLQQPMNGDNEKNVHLIIEIIEKREASNSVVGIDEGKL